MKKMRLIFGIGFMLMMSVFVTSCDEAEEIIDTDPIASFQSSVDEDNFFLVSFVNASFNATSYSWDFGDDIGTSTDENPEYTYTTGGTFTVTLVASNDEGMSASFSSDIIITDPDEALTLLAGTESKTWKLVRDEASLGIGPDEATWFSWFALNNDGSRPCLYDDEFIYHRDGTFEYQANGTFWAEADYYTADSDKADLIESCIDETVENLTVDGIDYSAWLSSDTHSYTYDASTNNITLTGAGAWMLLYKLGTSGYNEKGTTPPASTSFSAVLSDGGDSGVDTLYVGFQYEGQYWRGTYVSYEDLTDEPTLVTEEVEFGEDLEDITPSTMSYSFASATDFVELGTISGTSVITVGVDDPTDATAAKVGQFDRTEAEFQEAKFEISPDVKDINFENLTTISVEVYLPSTNDYTTTLTKVVEIGIADQSQTEEWWTDLYKYNSEELALDTWVTLTYQIETPSTVDSEGTTPKDRTDLDMVFISIGGGGHTVPGTFYIRNLTFE